MVPRNRPVARRFHSPLSLLSSESGSFVLSFVRSFVRSFFFCEREGRMFLYISCCVHTVYVRSEVSRPIFVDFKSPEGVQR